MEKTKMMLSVVAALLMLSASLVHGQTLAPGTAKPASGDDGWEFLVAPYMWAVSLDSKVRVGHYSASSTMTFSDILSDTQMAAEVRLEARKGRFGFFLDPTYLKLREDTKFTNTSSGATPPPTTDLTFTSEMWLIEFGGFYRAGTWPLDAKKGGRSLSVDLLGGGRYWYIHSRLDTSSPTQPVSTDSYVDPIVGARLSADLTDRLSFYLRGDIGGFGVGSDFTWNGAALFGYRITAAATAVLGYRVLYFNYKPSASSARYNVTMQGPVGGVMFSF